MHVVLWDWNGTLVDDAPVAWEAFNDVIGFYGQAPITFDHYREIYRHPVRAMYDAVGFNHARCTFEEVSHHYHEFYKARSAAIALHHDSQATLQELAEQGKRQAILSALPHELLPSAVQSHGINHFFESIFGLQDKMGHSKVGLGRDVIRFLGVEGKHVTIVGDSSHDAEVAQALNARCFLVARGLESPSRLQGNGFPVLDSFAGLVDLIG